MSRTRRRRSRGPRLSDQSRLPRGEGEREEDPQVAGIREMERGGRHEEREPRDEATLRQQVDGRAGPLPAVRGAPQSGSEQYEERDRADETQLRERLEVEAVRAADLGAGVEPDVLRVREIVPLEVV